MDSASEELGEIRTKMQNVTCELDLVLSKLAQKFHKEGIAERPITVFRRDRSCIPVKTAYRGQISK